MNLSDSLIFGQCNVIVSINECGCNLIENKASKQKWDIFLIVAEERFEIFLFYKQITGKHNKQNAEHDTDVCLISSNA